MVKTQQFRTVMKYLQGLAISSIVAFSHLAFGMVGGSLPAPTDPTARSTVILFKFDPDKQMTSSRCSASLIAKDLLITAAHCLFPDHYSNKNQLPPKNLIAYLGGYVASEGLIPAKIVHVKDVRVHPGYTASFKIAHEDRKDLALVKLERDVDLGFGPASILDPTVSLLKFQSPVVGGYGDTASSAVPAGGTYYVYNNYFVDLAPFAGESMVELIGPHFKGGYEGDSGGPAFLNDHGKLMLWGVFSAFVFDRGEADYEDLRASLTWITFASAALGSPVTF
jgi:hypothetical protein